MNKLLNLRGGIMAVFCCLIIVGFPPVAQAVIEIKAHYVEIVSEAVEQQCSLLEQVYGLKFGNEVAELGNAKVATTANGTMIGVRAPMAEHEKPITRLYFEVDDINEAVKKAKAAGAMIAYPPTKQGKTGTWAIYILDGIQYGLWQK